jgi:hypothetical protein
MFSVFKRPEHLSQTCRKNLFIVIERVKIGYCYQFVQKSIKIIIFFAVFSCNLRSFNKLFEHIRFVSTSDCSGTLAGFPAKARKLRWERPTIFNQTIKTCLMLKVPKYLL